VPQEPKQESNEDGSDYDPGWIFSKPMMAWHAPFAVSHFESAERLSAKIKKAARLRAALGFPIFPGLRNAGRLKQFPDVFQYRQSCTSAAD